MKLLPLLTLLVSATLGSAEEIKAEMLEELTKQVNEMNERLAHRNRRNLAAAVDLKDYIGLKINKDKSILSFGKNQDISFFRSGNGVLNARLNQFNIDGITNAANTVTVTGEINAYDKVNFIMGKSICTLQLKSGKIWTSCDVDSKTTRMLAGKLTGLKSCDSNAVMAKLNDISSKLPDQNAINSKIAKIMKQTFKPKSCWEVKQQDKSAKSGPYTVYPPAGGTITVMCEMSKNGGGWTRFLQLNSKGKSACKNYKDVPLDREIVGNYCGNQEYSFSRSMMINSKRQLMFTDDQNRIMWYRFTGCAKGSCTCDKAGGNAGLCFFLAVTADYSGGRPLFNNAAEDYDIWTEAYDWNQKRWENQGDGQCGGTNANAHSQFNCEPSKQKNLGQCGQRWHYGCRHDGSHKGGSTCSGGGAGCAWNWYTGLATSWRGGCNADKSAWMIQGPKANGQKRTAEVWFR